MKLEIKNINKIFKGFSLKDISFNIETNDLIAFVGNNGSGKTSTIKCIFNEYSYSGDVSINGENINNNFNLQKVAFFPDSNSIPLKIKVIDYFNYIAGLHFLKKDVAAKKIGEISEFLDLNEFLNKKIETLSAGWKKRILMGSILISSPEIIIFDEPTANVDIDGKEEFLDIIKQLHKRGVAILITSHILEELDEIANKLIIIDDGQIKYDDKFDGGKEKIKEVFYSKVKIKEKSKKTLGEFY